jgi:hypothetical protein
MWAVKNRTPYRAAACWGRDKHGTHEWIVAVKATYDIAPNGKLKLADEQLDPLLAPEYRGDPGSSSLRYDADLVGTKATTDVVLNGTAYAPQGRPAAQFTVAMTIGPIRKILRVNGEQHWEPSAFGLRPSAISPVCQVPIVYERAYGGYEHESPDANTHRIDFRNPIGCGLFSAARRRMGQPLPNFRYPNGSLNEAGPAGFGALDSFWSPRRELAGTYDEQWRRFRMPLPPDDWNPLCLQCAPVDQRPANALRGGELVELINLTAGGLLRFALPRVHLTFSTLIDEAVEEHRARVSTVIIEPDLPRLIMVWQSVISCPSPSDIDYLDDTTVREKVLI